MSYFISIKFRKVGAYTEVIVTDDLAKGTLMDSRELNLLKSELEDALEDVVAFLPKETE